MKNEENYQIGKIFERNDKKEFWIDQNFLSIDKQYIPYDRAGHNNYCGSCFRYTIPQSIYERLNLICKDNDFALFLYLQACLKILLYKISGCHDVMIGSPVYSNELTKIIANEFIPIISNMCSVDTFKDVLSKVKKDTLLAYENQDFPLQEIIDEHTDKLHNSLKDCMTILYGLNTIHNLEDVQDLSVSIKLFLEKVDSQLSIHIEYDTNTYKRETLDNVIRLYIKLITSIVQNPDCVIDEINLADLDEFRLIINNQVKREKNFYIKETYNELFYKQVMKSSNRIAVKCGSVELTYKELDDKSNKIAHILRKKKLRPNELVGIFFERSIDFIVSVIGIMKAGGAYLPLDTKSPIDRIITYLKLSKTKFLITKGSVIETIKERIKDIILETDLDVILFYEKMENRIQRNSIFMTYKAVRILLQGNDVSLVNDEYASWSLSLNQSKVQQRIQQLANYLEVCNARKVGIICDDIVHILITLKALKQNNIPYVIASKHDIKDIKLMEGVDHIITESQFIDVADRFAWEMKCVEGYIIIDHYDINNNEKQHNFNMLWNEVAQETTEDINDYGWENSYNGEPFSVEEMMQYIDNFSTKLNPYINKSKKVFEIGCGHGLVMFQLVDKVKEYYATDLSQVIIEKNKTILKNKNINHVLLKALPALNIKETKAKEYDVVVCSSVIHYFPNLIYLEEVIKSAINILGDKGVIYLDDIIDLGKKKELVASTTNYKKENPKARTKVDWDKDLLVPREFFLELKERYPMIEEIEFSNKLGSIENELTLFRYDVLIMIDKSIAKESTDTYKKAVLYEDLFNDHNENNSNNTMVQSITNQDIYDLTDIDLESCSYIKPINSINDLSYVIYTSGTTGTPKGVMVEQKGMLNHMYGKLSDLSINENSIVAQNAPYYFDISVWQMLSVLLVGGKVFIYDEITVQDIDQFIHQLCDDKVTILQVVPSYLYAMLKHIELFPCDFRYLTYIVVTGEEVPINLVNKWISMYPNITIVNAYGPTEASDDITHYLIKEKIDDSNVPIGDVVYNMKIIILDEKERVCPIGIKGEICTYGVGVGRGYINEIDKTKEVFKQIDLYGQKVRIYKTGDLGMWHPDHKLRFYGRKDLQVKIHGYRIELEEIENKLLKLCNMNEVVVLVKEKKDIDSNYLLAYYTADSPQQTEYIINTLRKYLPEYMIPTYYIKLDKMPLTKNGKIDRKKLSNQDTQQDDNRKIIKAANKKEEIILQAWKEVLNINEDISTEDSFYLLGGDSIMALQISSKLQKMGYKLSLQDIVKYPTIKEEADFLSSRNLVADQSDVVGKVEITPIQNYFFQTYKEHRNHYNQALMLKCNEIINMDILKKTVEILTHHHDALRTTFSIEGDKVTQVINKDTEEFNFCKEYDVIGNNYISEIKAISNSIQESMNLKTGPLMKIIFFHHEKEEYILIVMHHLITDNISWRILTDDFQQVYESLREDQKVDLGDKTMSYQQWSSLLIMRYKQGEFLQAKEYWEEFLIKNSNYIEKLEYTLQNKIKDTGVLSISFSKNETKKLQNETTNAYKTEVNELLLTALSMTMNQFLSTDKVLVDIEGHGREIQDLDIDISRTIGWFTSIYPIMLEYDKEKDLGNMIKLIKDHIRRIPDKGMSYGVLKYQDNMSMKLNACISYNYLGIISNKQITSKFEISDIDFGLTQDKDMNRPYIFEFSGVIKKEELMITLQYNNEQYTYEQMNELLKQYRTNLLSIIQYCVNKKDSEYTLSDYSDFNLSEEDVEEFFDDIE